MGLCVGQRKTVPVRAGLAADCDRSTMGSGDGGSASRGTETEATGNRRDSVWPGRSRHSGSAAEIGIRRPGRSSGAAVRGGIVGGGVGVVQARALALLTGAIDGDADALWGQLPASDRFHRWGMAWHPPSVRYHQVRSRSGLPDGVWIDHRFHRLCLVAPKHHGGDRDVLCLRKPAVAVLLGWALNGGLRAHVLPPLVLVVGSGGADHHELVHPSKQRDPAPSQLVAGDFEQHRTTRWSRKVHIACSLSGALVDLEVGEGAGSGHRGFDLALFINRKQQRDLSGLGRSEPLAADHQVTGLCNEGIGSGDSILRINSGASQPSRIRGKEVRGERVARRTLSHRGKTP